MLFYEDLYDVVFTSHERHIADEIIIISGYIGPKPIEALKYLPLKATVIYGMYGEQGISDVLYDQLDQISQNDDDLTILYSKMPVHSKIYIWRREGRITYALVGSANFSINGLKTAFREVLGETTFDTFQPLESYLSSIMENSLLVPDVSRLRATTTQDSNTDISDDSDVSECIIPLYLTNRSGRYMPEGSGINWGHGRAHNAGDTAYIPISMDNVRRFPQLFPEKKLLMTGSRDNRGRIGRHNEPIEIVWDDGTRMEGSLEGNNNGNHYPKQIASFPRKNLMGRYLRHRLGIGRDDFVTLEDLERADKNAVKITLMEEGLYYMELTKIED